VGRLDDALNHAGTAVDLADRIGGAVRHRHPRIWLGSTLAALDRFDEALTTYADGQQEATELGTGWSMPLWHFIRASLLSWRGDLDTAVAEAEAGLQVAEQLAARQLSLPIFGLLTRIALARADDALAGEHLAQMRRLIADGITAAPEDVAWTFAVYHEAMDEPQLALNELIGYFDSLPDRLLLLSHDPANAATLVRIALAAGDEVRASVAVRAARTLAERHPAVPSLVAAAQHAHGLRHGDLSALRAATEFYRASPRPLARAAAFEDAAVAEVRAGNGQAATQLLEEALGECAAAGAQRAVDRIESALHRLTKRRGRRARAPGSGLASLSRAELAVARLVSAGMSNRKAAAELFISPHTVGSHLRHILPSFNSTAGWSWPVSWPGRTGLPADLAPRRTGPARGAARGCRVHRRYP
jgi:DNA-binding CsgD family transcriptional regulator